MLNDINEISKTSISEHTHSYQFDPFSQISFGLSSHMYFSPIKVKEISHVQTFLPRAHFH